MKLLTLIARCALLACWVPVVWALFFYDGAREAWMKYKLGEGYEGPAEE